MTIIDTDSSRSLSAARGVVVHRFHNGVELGAVTFDQDPSRGTPTFLPFPPAPFTNAEQAVRGALMVVEILDWSRTAQFTVFGYHGVSAFRLADCHKQDIRCVPVDFGWKQKKHSSTIASVTYGSLSESRRTSDAADSINLTASDKFICRPFPAPQP